jgi:hypothetical protein
MFVEEIFRILFSCMEINTQQLMGELAPWHDPRQRVGRAGFNRWGRNFFGFVFFLFDCPFATFKLN